MINNQEQCLKYVRYKHVRTKTIQRTVILNHLINITPRLYSHNFLYVEFSYCNNITGSSNINHASFHNFTVSCYSDCSRGSFCINNSATVTSKLSFQMHMRSVNS